MKRKGYTVVIDALVALVFMMMVFAGLMGIYYTKYAKTASTTFKRLHYVSEDALDVMNKQGVLDSIGEAWAEDNLSSVTNLTAYYLDALIPEHIGYELVVENDTVLERFNETEDRAVAKTHSFRLLVGYKKGTATEGYVSRVFLANITEKITSEFAYFGGFAGEGNLASGIELPNDVNVLSAYLEVDAGSGFRLFVNGANCGNFTPVGAHMSANVQANLTCIGNFHAGNNTLELNFTSSDLSQKYIGGGFVKVVYNTSELDTAPVTGVMRYRFPGINGLVNLYDSFYVPGDLNGMNAYLHFKNNATTYLTIGSAEVFTGYGSPNEQRVNLTDANFSGKVSYSAISSKTVPLRMGVRNITVIEGKNADIVITTDLSFSMWQDRCMEGNWFMVYDRDNATPEGIAEAKHVCTSECVKFDGTLCHAGDGCSGCSYGCWRSYGCGMNSGSACTLPCYACISYGDYADSPTNRTGGGAYCYDCTNLGCQYCFETSETGEWCGIACGSSVYAYFGVNGTSSNPYAPSPPGSCSLYRCTSRNRTSCSFNRYVSCDQEYVNGHVTYAADGLPQIDWLNCPNQCFECNLTGVGLAKVLDRNFTQRILEVVGNKVGLASYGDKTYSTRALTSNFSRLSADIDGYYAGGETCICCALLNATKILSSGDPKQKRFILAMTDGEANVRCNNAFSDLNNDSVINAKDDAIQAACNASRNYNITVYAVGFGGSAGLDTLQRIASCGNGSFYASNSTQELEQIYANIAQKIVNVTYSSQIVNITGNLTSILYPDSYIEFSFTPENVTGYGEISITKDSERFGSCLGNFSVPDLVRISDAKVTSYSAEHWTDRLFILVNESWQNVYRLWDYGSNYTVLGDPYTVQIPPGFIEIGTVNTINISTADSFENVTGCSVDNRAIYTARVKRFTGYGDVFPSGAGCNWQIEFEGGRDTRIQVPESYSGSKECYYTNQTVLYNESDAIDDAAYRMFRGLDLDDNGRVDIEFDQVMLLLDTSQIGGVRSLWGPIRIKLIVWV